MYPGTSAEGELGYGEREREREWETERKERGEAAER